MKKINIPDFLVFTLYALPMFLSPLSTAGTGISLGLLLLGYALSGHWRNWRVLHTKPWALPFLLLFGWTLMGLIWTSDMASGLKVAEATGYGLFALIGATLPWQERWVKLFIRLFLAGLALNAVLAFLMTWKILPWQNTDNLPYTGFSDHIFLSLVLVQALLWLLWDFHNSWAIPKWSAALLGLLFFVQLIITPARSGQLAFILVMPIAIWLLYRGRWKYWALVILCLGVIGLGMSPVVQSRVELGIANVEQFIANQNSTTTSLGIRIATMEAGWEMLVEHPLMGVGTGDFSGAMKGLQNAGQVTNTPGITNTSAANSYLSEAAVLGFPGLFLLLWMMLAATIESWKNRKQPQGWFVFMYLAVFWLGGIYNTLNWGYDNAIGWALVIAIPMAAIGNRK
ncbi:O-antigen ligase family protein [Acidithiobacillus sulfurivorans]|uniref:O-antigen ligase family protein n=1 Tax=Acidithiobacillus sulfurivorans TaxID=1958756 RepID=A0ABS5ZXD6_9PROT|nr:O-antigen ligase family protein [Acidithiobacillus sulfurivorans]MBU2759854.1 O-antigen ligase family protein [Acidithiobacillus sulfurivorans]